ncbi:MAG: hypothetical protein AAF125_15800 [Chloroflexota bacterium]
MTSKFDIHDNAPEYLWPLLNKQPLKVETTRDLEDAVEALRALKIRREGFFQTGAREVSIIITADENIHNVEIVATRRGRSSEVPYAVLRARLVRDEQGNVALQGYSRYGMVALILAILSLVILIPVAIWLVFWSILPIWVVAMVLVSSPLSIGYVIWQIHDDRKTMLADLRAGFGVKANHKHKPSDV